MVFTGTSATGGDRSVCKCVDAALRPRARKKGTVAPHGKIAEDPHPALTTVAGAIINAEHRLQIETF